QIRGELYPAWYDQSQSQTGEDMTFDKVSRKKATECTPEAAKVVVKVIKMTDPITKRIVYTNTDGYDANADDDVHNCGDAKPSIDDISVSKMSGNRYRITVDVSKGKNNIRDVVIHVNGQAVATLSGGGSYSTVQTFSDDSTRRIE